MVSEILDFSFSRRGKESSANYSFSINVDGVVKLERQNKLLVMDLVSNFVVQRTFVRVKLFCRIQ